MEPPDQPRRAGRHVQGFPHGYEDLQRNAERLPVAGTSVVVPVASLHDVEHSKRTADRPKDRDYLARVGRLRASQADRTRAAESER
jgi:hypothetical protein